MATFNGINTIIGTAADKDTVKEYVNSPHTLSNDGKDIFLTNIVDDKDRVTPIIQYIFNGKPVIFDQRSQTGSYNSVYRFNTTELDRKKQNYVIRIAKNPIIKVFHPINEQELIFKSANAPKKYSVPNPDGPFIKKYSVPNPDGQFIKGTDVDLFVLDLIQSNLDENENGNNRAIWEEASRLQISPELVFYGFQLIPSHDYNLKPFRTAAITGGITYSLREFIISKAYDMDLHQYYEEKQQVIALDTEDNDIALDTEDNDVAKQIENILVKVHKKSLRIPFDIKPANMVIKKEDGKVDVKFVDLDPLEYTDDYSGPQKKAGLSDMFINLSIIIIANHFFYYLNRNIFQGYNIIEKDALLALFCQVEVGSTISGEDRKSRSMQKSSRNSDRSRSRDRDEGQHTELSKQYQHFSGHYFKSQDSGLQGRDFVACKDLFNIMVDNMQYLNPTDKANSKGIKISNSEKHAFTEYSTASTASASTASTNPWGGPWSGLGGKSKKKRSKKKRSKKKRSKGKTKKQR